jgi:ribonuclease-3
MSEFEEKLGYSFKDGTLPELALTHSSYANENRERGVLSNERLEFLGDSVLNMLTARFLYRAFPNLPEGELTKLRAAVVCEVSLHAIALELELGSFLLLGKGEELNGGRERVSILADAVEAVIAAIFLDGGLEAAEAFILPRLKHNIKAAAAGNTFKDYKTALQEIVQKNRQETLYYELTGESGPDHNKKFTVTLYLNSNPIAKGSGRSKKEAEQSAARAGLELMGQ